MTEYLLVLHDIDDDEKNNYDIDDGHGNDDDKKNKKKNVTTTIPKQRNNDDDDDDNNKDKIVHFLRILYARIINDYGNDGSKNSSVNRDGGRNKEGRNINPAVPAAATASSDSTNDSSTSAMMAYRHPYRYFFQITIGIGRYGPSRRDEFPIHVIDNGKVVVSIRSRENHRRSPPPHGPVTTSPATK